MHRAALLYAGEILTYCNLCFNASNVSLTYTLPVKTHEAILHEHFYLVFTSQSWFDKQDVFKSRLGFGKQNDATWVSTIFCSVYYQVHVVNDKQDGLIVWCRRFACSIVVSTILFYNYKTFIGPNVIYHLSHQLLSYFGTHFDCVSM
jgi:hypothetical protein